MGRELVHKASLWDTLCSMHTRSTSSWFGSTITRTWGLGWNGIISGDCAPEVFATLGTKGSTVGIFGALFCPVPPCSGKQFRGEGSLQCTADGSFSCECLPCVAVQSREIR